MAALVKSAVEAECSHSITRCSRIRLSLLEFWLVDDTLVVSL